MFPAHMLITRCAVRAAAVCLDWPSEVNLALMTTLLAPTMLNTAAKMANPTAGAIFDVAHTRKIELDLPYAGAVTPIEAWTLFTQGKAKLVDVRTLPEFKFVGSVPGSVNVVWHGYDPKPLAAFLDAMRHVASPSEPVLLICRSAVRSDSAADALTEAGYTRVYNVLEGFEGQRNHAGHRGQVDGWRHHGLPWTQD
jgi:rhodanese-related sulfurtransferase